jgi:hypothetical protein
VTAKSEVRIAAMLEFFMVENYKIKSLDVTEYQAGQLVRTEETRSTYQYRILVGKTF